MIFLMTPKFEWNGVRRVRKRHRNRINCAKPIKTSVLRSWNTYEPIHFNNPKFSVQSSKWLKDGTIGNYATRAFRKYKESKKKKKRESPLRPPIEGAKLVPEVGKNFGVEKLGNWEILDIILSVGKFLTPY